MTKRSTHPTPFALAAALTLNLGAAACDAKKGGGGISPQAMADALHSVMASDRTIYTKNVVNRLQNEEKILKASEHWKDEKTLPLPAQMFRMGAEMVSKESKGFTYALLSLWPVNKQNVPRTEAEKTGLQYVVDNPDKNYYADESLGGVNYFTAVYADKAIAPACVSCHNDHEDTPRKDFKMNDVMGGVVIRIAMR